MKLNLHLPLAEIYLVLILGLPVAAAAPSEAGRPAEIERAKTRVKRTISLLEEQAALARTMGEFVEEIGLFDNRIYGRVAEKGTLQEAKINSLNSQIEAKNSQLEFLQSTAGIERKFLGDQEGPGETYDLMIKQLEQEIADLCNELNQIMLPPLEGGTELLDGSLLLNEVLPPVEMLGEHTARRALELQRKQLEQLEREQQKLRKKMNASPDSSGKKKENN